MSTLMSPKLTNVSNFIKRKNEEKKFFFHELFRKLYFKGKIKDRLIMFDLEMTLLNRSLLVISFPLGILVDSHSPTS